MGRGKEVEKIRREKHESSEEKHILRGKKSNPNFIKMGQLHCGILEEGKNMKKEDKPKEKLSFVSYKNHIIIFGASHYWIFLTHNTSKLRNSAQNHTHIYIYINSTHHLIQLVAFKPVQSA